MAKTIATSDQLNLTFEPDIWQWLSFLRFGHPRLVQAIQADQVSLVKTIPSWDQLVKVAMPIQGLINQEGLSVTACDTLGWTLRAMRSL